VKSILILSLAFTLALVAPATDARAEPPTDAMKADILKLLELTGIEALMGEMSGMLLGQLKKMAADVPDEKWKDIEPRLSSQNMIDMSIPIYAEHFSHDEIKTMVAFYETPVGQKAIQTMPLAVRESMTATQQWGQATGTAIIEELEAAGYTVERPGR
jgi:hypothetical protein